MKNIHILPTDKPSRLVLDDTTQQLILINKGEALWGNRNIYITSNEEIKEGDWVYCLREGFEPVLKQKVNPIGVNNDEMMKKIILTTDQDLIKDGVQAIDDEFLEWFVKNPSCEEVKVKYDKDIFPYGVEISNGYGWYKIIIPKEEPKQEWTPTQGEQVWIKVFSNWSSGTYIGYDTTKHIHLVRENEEGGGNLLSSSKILPYKSMPNEPKQETLEEAAESYWVKQPYNEDAFIEGAKWQAERMYSEADKIMKFLDTEVELKLSDKKTIERIKWYFETYFEQFKKK